MLNRKATASILLMLVLTGCEPVPSGDPVGMRYPIEYVRLMNMKLPTHLDVPVEGVKRQNIQDTWGAARGNNRKHEGIDIFAKRGTPVLSATSGIVLEVGTNNLGGRVIWVLGPEGSRHYYAHLEDYAPEIAKGDWVEAGTVLGYVGNTGNAQGTPPHLHYGIYLSEGAVNPYPYLRENKNDFQANKAG